MQIFLLPILSHVTVETVRLRRHDLFLITVLKMVSKVSPIHVHYGNRSESRPSFQAEVREVENSIEIFVYF